MLQDFRLAARTLLRSPGFTATAALTLALGIGVTSLMVGVVDAVLLRPLPYADPGRLMLIFNTSASASEPDFVRATALDFEDYRSRAHRFDGMAAHVGTGFTLTSGGEPELVLGQLVTPDFFRVLGVPPALGRTFAAGEFAPGRSDVVVLSDRLWKRRFGGQSSVVGSVVSVNGRPFQVAGVMPPGFEYFGRRYEIWSPLASPRTPDLPPLDRSAHYLQIVGRLKPGVTPAQGNAEIAAIGDALAAQYPATNADMRARAVRLQDFAVRDVETPLYLLLGAVTLVVLIACANVTSLLLARAVVRAREVAIRQALGAARWRLARQFLAETLTLYGLGAAGALALASWGTAALVRFGPADIPRLEHAVVDGRVLAATMAVALLTGLMFGLGPAVRGAAADPADALRAGGRGASAARGPQRVRAALVVSEIALAVVLLVGAGLALHSLVRLTSVDPGFDADGQLTFTVVFGQQRYPDSASLVQASVRTLEQLAAVPGALRVGATTQLPLSGQNVENRFTVEGYTFSRAVDEPVAGMRGVVGDYFDALGARLRSGRTFTAADRAGSQPVAIVNEAFTRRYWPGQDPIGRRLREGGGPAWRTVVGVIADVKHTALADDARPEVSLPYSQLEPGFMTTWSRGLSFVVRGAVPASALAPSTRAAVRTVDPLLSLNDLQSIATLAWDSVAEPRFRTLLLGGFALLAISLASLGVFGLLSYFVTQRTREIGVRVALGASSADIVRMVVGRGLALAGTGLALGLLAAIPLTRYVRSVLFEVSPLDLPTLASVVIGLALVAGVASYLPARRALRVEPVTALHLD